MKNFAGSLKSYRERCETTPSPGDQTQVLLADRCLVLTEQGPRAFDRKAPEHFTGSALVTNPEMDRVLLTLHAKLGLWLQLGGHADGQTDLSEVALRECKEESGLERMDFLAPSRPIFDLDIHPIPERKGEPSHTHFDVRYLIVADPGQPFTVSTESKDMRWIPLTDAYGLTTQCSMHRQFDKLRQIKKHWVERETCFSLGASLFPSSHG